MKNEKFNLLVDVLNGDKKAHIDTVNEDDDNYGLITISTDKKELRLWFDGDSIFKTELTSF